MEAYDVIVNQPVVIDNVSTVQISSLFCLLIKFLLGYRCDQSWFCWRTNTEMPISKLVSSNCD